MSHFFEIKPLSLREIADVGECRIERGNPSDVYKGVAPIRRASGTCVTFFYQPRYARTVLMSDLEATQAGVCIVAEEHVSAVPASSAVLVSEKARTSFALITRAFYTVQPLAKTWIHPTAVVDESVILGTGCQIGPGVVIEPHVTLGDQCVIGAQTWIGQGVTLGARCRVDAHVSLSHAHIGDDVLIKAGARIGQSGFGFVLEEQQEMAHVDVPQVGRVLIGNGVEIGSNTTVDRGALDDTILEDWVRVDNLVQIAHNVHVEKGSVLIAQTGIAGSTRIGRFSILAGQVGVSGHLKIAPYTRIAAKSGVMRNTQEREVIAGSPAVPVQQWRRQSVMLARLVKGRLDEKGGPGGRN